jgi:serine/threonine protein kinase
MDAFEGESLASVIEKRGSRVFSVSEIESWAVQLCQALEDAHKIGVFHRDISPGNIYFRPDGKILLAGFGFSRCVGDALRRLDGNEDAVPVNVSPQHLDGQPAARTDDIYACGALFYELLTGQAPFSGADIANQIRNSPPKPVSEARPKDLPPVPENWEKAIAACLSKNGSPPRPRLQCWKC